MRSDFLFGLTPGDISNDIETYPNIFTCAFTHTDTGSEWLFEISDRRNDLALFIKFIETMRDMNCRGVGFNSIGFDYPVIHFIWQHRHIGITAEAIYDKAMSIINAPHNARFSHMVWESDHVFKQIDLYKIHHFDNPSKATSLKELEFKMGMSDIQDLPFPVGTILDDQQKDALIEYNFHDTRATTKFYHFSKSAIEMREDLSASFKTSMMNCSDVKIGEKILVHEIEKAGLPCYAVVDGRKKKRQTKRDSINLAEVVLPYVGFDRPEFKNILDYLTSKTITETKGVFNGLIANVDGLEYKIGTGGLHASVNNSIFSSNETHQIVDVDVASFYPNLAIKNKLYPAHLGEAFCDAYEGIYHTRKTFPKKDPKNGAFKLALNGAYGGSNNEYSPFLDPAYTMAITINGQMLLCMLVEQMIKVPGLQMIQANTDGITYLCPREYLEHTRSVCRWWEQLTNLELEEALYSRMWVRDVNSYVAEYESGDLKRIGAYAHVTATEEAGTRELSWGKDWSARVVAKAAEAALVRGEDIRQFIIAHPEIMDFMLRIKVPRSNLLEWGGEEVQKISRYYISKTGKPLEKVMPPAGPLGAYKRANKLTDEYFNTVMAEVGDAWDERIHTKNKSKYEERRTGINTGWLVEIANTLPELISNTDEWMEANGNDGADVYEYEEFRHSINLDWYVAEAEKLVKPLTHV